MRDGLPAVPTADAPATPMQQPTFGRLESVRIRDYWKDEADAIFEALVPDKEAIEAEVGELDWQDLPDRKACRISDYKQPVTFEDREQWPELFSWLKDRAEAFKAAFSQRVKDIDLPAPQDSPAARAASGGDSETPAAAAADRAGNSGTSA